MRKHIAEVQATKGREVEITVEAKAVGVSVKGREVTKVAPGSQAAQLGVEVGWKLSHVSGEAMPLGGQAAADAITRALQKGKAGGTPYLLKFVVNDDSVAVSNVKKDLGCKPGSALKRGGHDKVVAGPAGPFSHYSAGLQSCGSTPAR